MIKVFRLEYYVEKYDKHFGPYTASSYDQRIEDACINFISSSEHSPLPHYDGIKDFPGTWVFGCTTIFDMLMWFSNQCVLQELIEAGFEIAMYELEDDQEIIFGDSQCAFNPSDKRTVLDIDALWEMR